MIGLLSKAHHVRNALGLGDNGRDEFAFDPDSGISREDQKEILSEIEKVATQSRISVTPEVFALKAAKRGILFPIMVIVGSIAALAIGLGVFYFFFQRGQTQISREDNATITAEGKLIAEVKKESEAKLQEKNQQIGQIQTKLAEIDKQRLDLQTNMDAKIKDRETQLRDQMAAQLDAEKVRLQKQGLSDQDIQRKLSDLSAQQQTAFAKQLDTFRAQAEAERTKSEATLKSLQSQFNTDLAKANTERQQVLADSRQREADLQTQLAQKTTELQSAQAQTQAQQAQTQAQLQSLASQKQQEDLVTQQLVGLYSVAQADIAAKNYAKALASLQAIGSYVNSPDIMALPGLAKRRTVDLFIVDSLSTLVQDEIAKAKVDTSSLVNAANQIADVRSKVSDADGFLAAGKLSDAEKLYGQALAAIPEIAKSYAYFTAKARDAEAARQDALHAGLARAEAAFDAGRYDEMLAAYKDALGYLPEPVARLDRTLSNVSAMGAFQASQKAQAEQTRTVADQSRAAAPIVTQGNALLKDGKYPDSLARFLAVLASYPLSSQAPQAVKGISDAVAGMDGQASSTLKSQVGQAGALSAQLSAVQKQLDASVSELTGVKRSIITLLGLKQDPVSADSAALMTALNQHYGSLSNASSANSGLQAQLDAANQKNTQLAASISKLNADNSALTADLNAAREEAARKAALAAQGQQQPAAQAASTEASGLSAADQKRLDDLNALLLSYTRDYAAKEDANLGTYARDPQKALMLSVGSRDSFLASLSKMFDGLLGRVKRYEAQSAADGITTGRRGALDDVLAVMTGLANQKTPEGQKSYLDAKVTAEKDPKMKSVLGSLQKIVAGK
jgi:hypothetical protein